MNPGLVVPLMETEPPKQTLTSKGIALMAKHAKIFVEMTKRQYETIKKGYQDTYWKMIPDMKKQIEDEKKEKKKPQTFLGKLWEAAFKNGIFSNKKGGMASLLTGLGKIIKKSSEWWLEILLLLGMLAIFDPNGNFIVSLIDWLMVGLLWVINMIARILPKLLNTLFVKILPKVVIALADAVKKILSGLSTMFSNWAKNLPKDSFLRKALEFFAWLTSPDGPIQRILDAVKDFVKLMKEGEIGEAFKELWSGIWDSLKMIFDRAFQWFDSLSVPMQILVGLIAAIIIGYKIYIFWETVKQVLTKASISGSIAEAAARWAAIIPILKIIAVVAILIAIGYLVYKYWDNLKVWFAKAWEWIKEKAMALWETLKKVFKAVWDVITWPFKMYIKWLKFYIGLYIKLFLFLWKYLKIGFEWVAEKFKSFLNGIKERIMSVVEGVKAIFNKFTDIGKGIWESIKNALSPIYNWFMENFFNPISATFTAFFMKIKSWFGTGMISGSTESYKQMALIGEQIGMGGTETAELFKKLQGASTNEEALRKYQEFTKDKGLTANEEMFKRFLVAAGGAAALKQDYEKESGEQYLKNINETLLKIKNEGKKSSVKPAEKINKK